MLQWLDLNNCLAVIRRKLVNYEEVSKYSCNIVSSNLCSVCVEAHCGSMPLQRHYFMKWQIIFRSYFESDRFESDGLESDQFESATDKLTNKQMLSVYCNNKYGAQSRSVLIDIAQWRENPNLYLDLNRDLIEDLGLYLKIGLDLDLEIAGFGHHSLDYTS